MATAPGCKFDASVELCSVQDDLTHRKMVELNRHYILKEMKASHILYFLPQLKDHIGEIFRLERREPQTVANDYLITKLLECDDLPSVSASSGWFSTFITALEEAEFHKLANRLTRKDVKDDRMFVQLIFCNLPVLCDVDPNAIMPHLLSKNVISKKDLAEIQSICRNDTSSAAMLELIQRLPLHVDNWFVEFVIALKQNNSLEALKALEPLLSEAKSDDSVRRIVVEMDATAAAAATAVKQKYVDDTSSETELKKLDKTDDVLAANSRQDTKPKDIAGCNKLDQFLPSQKVGYAKPMIQEPRAAADNETFVKKPPSSSAAAAAVSVTENIISLREDLDSNVTSSLCSGHSRPQPALASVEENVPITDTISIRGLPRDVTDTQLVAHFGMIGDIKRNHSTGRPLVKLLPVGQAEITYELPDYASFAVEVFNKQEFNGCNIDVTIASQRVGLRSYDTADVQNAHPNRTSVKFAENMPKAATLRATAAAAAFGAAAAENIDADLAYAIAQSLNSSGQKPDCQELELRSYQKELAQKAMDGKNCLVVAPTGSGKTHVALAIVQHHFEKYRSSERKAGQKDPKVVFFVPTVALVEQQKNMFYKYLGNLKIIGLSGDQDAKLPLMDLLPHNDVLVMTPQIMENALRETDVQSLGEFTLLIFDECHHANKNHPYNAIMSHYIDELFEAQGSRIFPTLPQIVGLTASVGVGKAKSMKQAVEHILKLCANLDCREICTVSNHLAELTKHVNRPTEDTTELKGRVDDPFFARISNIMKAIEERMFQSDFAKELTKDQPNLFPAPRDHGSDRYTQWINGLEKPIARLYRQDARRFFVACQRHLMMFNTALLINADCRTMDALTYIEKELKPSGVDAQTLLEFSDETDKWLRNLYDCQKRELTDISKNPRYENPKLKYLKDLIVSYYQEDDKSCGIVFVKTREMTVALMNWMKDTPELRDLNPHNLVGSNAPSQKAGQTQFKQEDVLKCFKDGQHKLIIATSVAEEGLDVRQCNWVIRYEHVTNSIARVQSRGRARAENAKYTLVAEQGRGVADKEMCNKIRETMMQRAINMIQNEEKPDDIRKKIREFQELAKVEREMAAKGKAISEKMRASRQVAGGGQSVIRCHKCDCFAAYMSDIRTIENSHHVIIDSQYRDRIVIRPHPTPMKFENFELTGKIYCSKCHWDWGVMGVYKKVSFPIIKISSFVVVGPDEVQRDKYKKWKEVPFHVPPLTLQDLTSMGAPGDTDDLADGFSDNDVDDEVEDSSFWSSGYT